MPFDPISRNDPCKCGSGKKYKLCCIHTTIFDRAKKAHAIAGDGASLDTPYAQLEEEGSIPFFVWIAYTCQDALGVAEIDYCYPVDQLIQLTNGGVVPVQSLIPGMEFVLELGRVATVTKVDSPKPQRAEPALHDRFGAAQKRLIGRLKFTGWVQLMSVTIAGEEHGVTPGHLYWSETRNGWFDIGSFVVGELVLTSQKQAIPIEAMAPPKWKYETVYNFEVEDYHTYYVGKNQSVWVHNGLEGGGCGVPKAAKVRRPRMPDPEKWKKDGGRVIFNKDGSTTYVTKEGISVKFSAAGHPDFSKFVHPKNGTVEIVQTGKNYKDFPAANDARGLPQPEGWTWHHHENGTTMQLIPTRINRTFSHTGGASWARQGGS